MDRDSAIASAVACLESGVFRDQLARRVAIATESQNPERRALLDDYLKKKLMPAFVALGCPSSALVEQFSVIA